MRTLEWFCIGAALAFGAVCLTIGLRYRSKYKEFYREPFHFDDPENGYIPPGKKAIHAVNGN